jgi:hypothetical protein
MGLSDNCSYKRCKSSVKTKLRPNTVFTHRTTVQSISTERDLSVQFCSNNARICLVTGVIISCIQFQVRSAFRRADTPAPVHDLSDKVLRIKKEYMERESFPGEFALSPTLGKFYDKKPFPIHLEAGRQYSWCSCGHSKSQVPNQFLEYYRNSSDNVLLLVW